MGRGSEGGLGGRGGLSPISGRLLRALGPEAFAPGGVTAFGGRTCRKLFVVSAP